MISAKITNLKTFTSHLLVKDTFSGWSLVEAQILTHSVFTINGRKNPSYFTQEEQDDTDTGDYNPWELLRPVCYEIIKGKNLPSYFKFVFRLDACNTKKILSSLSDYKESDIDGLFLNIKYENGSLTLTTGTSLKIFTLDKSLDKTFDAFITRFLDDNSIEYSFC
ncbi:MAG: DUF5721 family protein [Thermoflexaceae bacterium]|nr:DUF5721 family protein [Thermoflexaceae bacterium]